MQKVGPGRGGRVGAGEEETDWLTSKITPLHRSLGHQSTEDDGNNGPAVLHAHPHFTPVGLSRLTLRVARLACRRSKAGNVDSAAGVEVLRMGVHKVTDLEKMSSSNLQG